MNKTSFGMAVSVALLSLGLSGGAQAQQSSMTFFVTSTGSGTGADFGGLAGADKHCQSLAAAAGAGQAHVARLSQRERCRRETGRERARPHRQGPVAQRKGKTHRPQS